MAQGERLARVVHAIPGRLRVRLEGDGWTPAGIEELGGGLDALRATPGIREVRLNWGARSIAIRYEPTQLTPEQILGAATAAGVDVVGDGEGPEAARDGTAALPRRLDRRMVRTLAISLASLYGARQVGAAVGGAATWPAYFAIWFALRRLADRVAPRGEAPAL